MRTKAGLSLLTFCAAFIITGCAPEVGSDAWCKQLDEKPKADWSLNEASDYAKNCIFRKKNAGEQSPGEKPD